MASNSCARVKAIHIGYQHMVVRHVDARSFCEFLSTYQVIGAKTESGTAQESSLGIIGVASYDTTVWLSSMGLCLFDGVLSGISRTMSMYYIHPSPSSATLYPLSITPVRGELLPWKLFQPSSVSVTSVLAVTETAPLIALLDQTAPLPSHYSYSSIQGNNTCCLVSLSIMTENGPLYAVVPGNCPVPGFQQALQCAPTCFPLPQQVQVIARQLSPDRRMLLLGSGYWGADRHVLRGVSLATAPGRTIVLAATLDSYFDWATNYGFIAVPISRDRTVDISARFLSMIDSSRSLVFYAPSIGPYLSEAFALQWDTVVLDLCGGGLEAITCLSQFQVLSTNKRYLLDRLPEAHEEVGALISLLGTVYSPAVMSEALRSHHDVRAILQQYAQVVALSDLCTIHPDIDINFCGQSQVQAVVTQALVRATSTAAPMAMDLRATGIHVLNDICLSPATAIPLFADLAAKASRAGPDSRIPPVTEGQKSCHKQATGAQFCVWDAVSEKGQDSWAEDLMRRPKSTLIAESGKFSFIRSSSAANIWVVCSAFTKARFIAQVLSDEFRFVTLVDQATRTERGAGTARSLVLVTSRGLRQYLPKIQCDALFFVDPLPVIETLQLGACLGVAPSYVFCSPGSMDMALFTLLCALDSPGIVLQLLNAQPRPSLLPGAPFPALNASLLVTQFWLRMAESFCGSQDVRSGAPVLDSLPRAITWPYMELVATVTPGPQLLAACSERANPTGMERVGIVDTILAACGALQVSRYLGTAFPETRVYVADYLAAFSPRLAHLRSTIGNTSLQLPLIHTHPSTNTAGQARPPPLIYDQPQRRQLRSSTVVQVRSSSPPISPQQPARRQASGPSRDPTDPGRPGIQQVNIIYGHGGHRISMLMPYSNTLPLRHGPLSSSEMALLESARERLKPRHVLSCIKHYKTCPQTPRALALGMTQQLIRSVFRNVKEDMDLLALIFREAENRGRQAIGEDQIPKLFSLDVGVSTSLNGIKFELLGAQVPAAALIYSIESFRLLMRTFLHLPPGVAADSVSADEFAEIDESREIDFEFDPLPPVPTSFQGLDTEDLFVTGRDDVRMLLRSLKYGLSEEESQLVLPEHRTLWHSGSSRKRFKFIMAMLWRQAQETDQRMNW